MSIVIKVNVEIIEVKKEEEGDFKCLEGNKLKRIEVKIGIERIGGKIVEK